MATEKKIVKLLDVIFFFIHPPQPVSQVSSTFKTFSNNFLETHYVGTSFLNLLSILAHYSLICYTQSLRMGIVLVSPCSAFLGLLTDLVLIFTIGAQGFI